MSDPGDDIEFLVRSKNRIAVLDALIDEAATRPQLRARLGVERVTLGRILQDLEDRRWVTAENDTYQATFLGTMIAEEFLEFRSFMAFARELREFVRHLPDAPLGFPVERLRGSTITTGSEGDPYRPVRRFMDLLRNTDTLRGYDTTTIAPLYVEEIREEILGGMRTTIVYRPPVIEQIVTDHREAVAEANETGHLSLHVAEDLPFGLAIFDDRVGIGAYDESGVLRAFVDTDDPAVREWAIDSYESHLEAATPLDDWIDDPL